jgi:hypothetical protein
MATRKQILSTASRGALSWEKEFLSIRPKQESKENSQIQALTGPSDATRYCLKRVFTEKEGATNIPQSTHRPTARAGASAGACAHDPGIATV